MFKDFLCKQMELHPSMQPQDVIKLCYQAAFGAEHLLEDFARVKEYFDAEFLKIAERDESLYEPISNDVYRVNMAAWKKAGLPKEWLFNLFVLSARVRHEDGESSFRDYLTQVEGLPFCNNEWREYIRLDMQDGIKAIHHSEDYRENEKPAYRVISGEYIRLIPIFEIMAKYFRQTQSAILMAGGTDFELFSYIIAIDGRAASGKTTMASQLAEVLGAGVIHMDDFFLPEELRTPERFAKHGGNVHHERFIQEVLPFLKSADAFSYKVYDCKQMDFNGNRDVAQSNWRIIEGAYSCHPVLGDYMDFKIFSDVSPKEQQARIKKRNGPQIAEEYTAKWIPLEESYLKAYQIKENACVFV